MKADDFLCSNIKYDTILNSIKAMKSKDLVLIINISDTESLCANNMLLEIIKAYDSQNKKNENLLKFAVDIADMIYDKTKEPMALINKLQAVKRQRLLTNDEITSLGNLRNKRNQTKIMKCAVAILLGENDVAKKLLDELPEEDKRRLTDYPIYNLLTNGDIGSDAVENAIPAQH
jgi:hypothetical protein